jgi:hypothetical protein
VAEDYVRPPLVGSEPRSHRFAVWRFRLLLLVALAGLAVGIVFLIRALIATPSEGSPSVAPRPTLAAAR